MSTSPLPKPEPQGKNRGKLIGLGVFLAFLVFLLALVSYGLGLWGSGELTTP